ncbi:MAG: hypothetical protein ACRYGM_02535 [Janthinobacterium lividum]
MQRALPAIQVGQAPDGTLTYLVDRPLAALPPVRSRDLAAAWDSARAAAIETLWGAARRFRFRRGDGSFADLELQDRDARCWAEAVEITTGLQTPYGLALCLRLLALVDLLAHASWTASLCRVRRGGAELHPALLRMAASAELTDDACFDETGFRAGLALLSANPAGDQP